MSFSLENGDEMSGNQMTWQCNPAYAGMIETMDENVGRLMAKLDEPGIAENTLVVFTTDNGGLNNFQLVTSNASLRSGKGWLYEGGVRVPWIVRLPGLIRPGSECELPVIAADILPAILDVCGLMPLQFQLISQLIHS